MNNFAHTAIIPGATAKVSYTASSARTSAAVSTRNGPVLVRLWATTDCFVKVGGSTVTAQAGDMPVTAKVAQEIVMPADGYVAAIQQSAGGDLYVTECRVGVAGS